MSRLRRLRQLWREIPTIECKGLCWDSCGPITSSVLEEDLMRQASGTGHATAPHPLMDGAQMCCHLSAEGRCGVYEVRPTICRLWGVTGGLTCHHGCQPARPLTDAEGFVLLARSLVVGGDTAERQARTEALLVDLVEALETGALQVRLENEPGRTSVTLIDNRPLTQRDEGAGRLPSRHR